MTRGPGRHSERNFRAAEQHYNAAEWPTDAERGSVPLCRHQILNWFYGLNRSEDSKPTGSLGPASQKQLVWTSTKLANRRTGVLDWLAYCRRLCCSSRQSGRCTDVSVGQSSGNCHIPNHWSTSLPWDESEAVRASAVTTRETSWFLQSRNSRADKGTWDGVVKGMVLCLANLHVCRMQTSAWMPHASTGLPHCQVWSAQRLSPRHRETATRTASLSILLLLDVS